MTSRDEMRAADADRERVAQRLRNALDEGRLTLDELDDRLRGVWIAKTFGELDAFLADLPAPVPEQGSQVAPARAVPPAPAPRSDQGAPRLATWLSVLWKLWFVAVSINLVIWFLIMLTTQEMIYPWPIWVAGPWGVANLTLTILFPPKSR